MDVVTIETSSLGNRSYVVTDGDTALVVDPQRDLDRVLSTVDELGVRVTDVFETHVHNDYVSGGLALAECLGASYHLAADEDLGFAHDGLADEDEVEVGTLLVTALHTPGHTPTHMSYVVTDDDGTQAVFTGGSLLFGSVGRTDLISAERTEELTRAQYGSAQRLAALPDDTKVLPTHGFGSFCSSGETSSVDSSTIGEQRRENQALTITDEDTFVTTLLAGLDAYPAYYAHMAPRNRSGPSAADLEEPSTVDPTELRRRIHDGEWVVDLRTRTAFAHDHLTGTINVQLDDSASTYLGWLVPWDTPVTLLADTPDEVAAMQRQLARIGIDRPAGRSTGPLPDTLGHGSYAVADFAGLRDTLADDPDIWVLDSRLALEWDDAHLAMAHHVPLHELEMRLGEIPDDRSVWIHCATGYRASIGASLLARAGRRVVLVDDDVTRGLELIDQR